MVGGDLAVESEEFKKKKKLVDRQAAEAAAAHALSPVQTPSRKRKRQKSTPIAKQEVVPMCEPLVSNVVVVATMEHAGGFGLVDDVDQAGNSSGQSMHTTPLLYNASKSPNGVPRSLKRPRAKSPTPLSFIEGDDWMMKHPHSPLACDMLSTSSRDGLDDIFSGVNPVTPFSLTVGTALADSPLTPAGVLAKLRLGPAVSFGELLPECVRQLSGEPLHLVTADQQLQ